MLHTKFQVSKPSGSGKKIFEYFSMNYYGWNLHVGPLARGHLGLWDLHLKKLGRVALGHATYQISNKWF